MKLEAEWIDSIERVSGEAWNRLLEARPYPFLDWRWLRGLERSGSAGEAEGWAPCHLLLRHRGRLVAAAALYLKAHSRGEFVFDQEWAHVSLQVGVPYYPKLLGMSPFSPAIGYRFLTDPDWDETLLYRRLMTEIDDFCGGQGIQGCHFLHGDPDFVDQMRQLGLKYWLHHGLVWENPGFADFDAYLATFRSHQRKNIRRERRKVRESGIHFRVLVGEQIPAEYFQHMFLFYSATCVKYWGYSYYLKQAFFHELAAHLADRIAFVCAYEPDRELPIAMSLLVHEGEWLFGRYWGCLEEYDYLHFETCYYQAIEWAIQRGIRYYDAGSGGASQKKHRGFPARPKPSLHRFYHPIMGRIWDANIDRINVLEQEQIDMINGDRRDRS